MSAATNVFDALLAPGGYGLTVYNSPEGISIDGNKATVNPVDLTGAIEPHPGLSLIHILLNPILEICHHPDRDRLLAEFFNR